AAVAGHLDGPVTPGRGTTLAGRGTTLPSRGTTLPSRAAGLDRERREGAAALRGPRTGLRTARPGTATRPGTTTGPAPGATATATGASRARRTRARLGDRRGPDDRCHRPDELRQARVVDAHRPRPGGDLRLPGQRAHVAGLLRQHDRDHVPTRAGTRRPAGAVQVGLVLGRRVHVHHE